MSSMPSSARRSPAAATCGAPPSTTTSDGVYANLRGAPVVGSTSRGPSPASSARCRSSSSRVKRRVITSRIAPTSLLPSTVLMMNRRYSLLRGSPSSNTTIEATTSVPMVWEMS